MKIQRNDFVVKFIIALFLLSIAVGFICYMSYKPDLSLYIEEFKNLVSSTHQNTFFLHMGLITMIFMLSVSVIGSPAIFLYLIYEGFSIGYVFGMFAYAFKIKGMIFYLLFILTSKLVYTAIALIFIILSVKFVFSLVESFISKNRDAIYKIITKHFYRYLVILSICLVNSILIYFLSNFILRVAIGLI